VDERGKRVVVIDGTVYEFEGDGKKLKRMDGGSFSFLLFLSFLFSFRRPLTCSLSPSEHFSY
jgi:hypothetical protein